jgi:AcrR family transcriptional regulator
VIGGCSAPRPLGAALSRSPWRRAGPEVAIGSRARSLERPRAGVERRTLYRHFPTEADLFAACSTHYFAANPWPDLGNWRAIRDPQQRLARALDELYAYYERTEPMLGNVLRDAELVDVARDAVAPLHAYLEEAAEVLTIGRQVRGRRRQLLRGALRHALAFSTWRSLLTNGIGRADAVKLITALVEGAATPRRRSD